MQPLAFETILKKTHEVAKVISPIADEVDREARWPEEGIRALQVTGLGGLVVPEACGGLGKGLLALAHVSEILGQECASTALCFGMHCVGTSVIAAKATADQQQRYLFPISEGKHITTLSLSEPGSGAHFYLPQTKLEAVSPDSYRITGTKTFVTNGGYADSYVVSTVAADPNAPIDQFSCVMVPKRTEGLKWGAPWAGLGMRGNSARSLELQGVTVPRQDLLGKEGDQIWYIFHIVAPYFLMAMAGTYLGVSSAALEEAMAHLTKRHYSNSGTSLARLPVLQHRLGSLWAVLERTRRLIYHAGSIFDEGATDALAAVFSAKAEAADCAVHIVNEVMTLSGGIGYRDDSKLSRLLRDARAAHVMAPTTDILRMWTGRALLGTPLLVE